MKTLLAVLLCFVVGLVLGCAPQPTADSVVADMTAAYGGAEKLASITDQVSHWDFTMYVTPPGAEDAGPMQMPMTITYKKPGMIRFDSMMNGQIVHAMSYDGNKTWMYEMGQTMEGNEQHNKESAFNAATWIDGLHNYKEKGFTVELLPNEMIDEQDYIVLKATHENGYSQTWYINPETKYIERAAGDYANMMGEPEPMYMTMSDYKVVDGLPLAHYVAHYKQDGTMVWEATMTDVKHNTGVEDSVFMMSEDEDMMAEDEDMSMK